MIVLAQHPTSELRCDDEKCEDSCENGRGVVQTPSPDSLLEDAKNLLYVSMKNSSALSCNHSVIADAAEHDAGPGSDPRAATTFVAPLEDAHTTLDLSSVSIVSSNAP